MPSPVALLFCAPVACRPHVNTVSSTACTSGAAACVVGSIARTNRSGSISAIGPGSSAARASAVTWSSSAVTSATPSWLITSASASHSDDVSLSAESTAWIPATRFSSWVAPDQLSSNRTR
jgi:hypothetical protein